MTAEKRVLRIVSGPKPGEVILPDMPLNIRVNWPKATLTISQRNYAEEDKNWLRSFFKKARTLTGYKYELKVYSGVLSIGSPEHGRIVRVPLCWLGEGSEAMGQIGKQLLKLGFDASEFDVDKLAQSLALRGGYSGFWKSLESDERVLQSQTVLRDILEKNYPALSGIGYTLELKVERRQALVGSSNGVDSKEWDKLVEDFSPDKYSFDWLNLEEHASWYY